MAHEFVRVTSAFANERRVNDENDGTTSNAMRGKTTAVTNERKQGLGRAKAAADAPTTRAPTRAALGTRESLLENEAAEAEARARMVENLARLTSTGAGAEAMGRIPEDVLPFLLRLPSAGSDAAALGRGRRMRGKRARNARVGTCARARTRTLARCVALDISVEVKRTRAADSVERETDAPGSGGRADAADAGRGEREIWVRVVVDDDG